MRRYYAETNAFSLVLFVDKKNKAYVIDEQAFNEPLTLATAKTHDYGNLEGCETAQECVECMGFGDIVDFKTDEFEELIECGDVLEFARMEVEQSESEKISDIIEEYEGQTVTPEELEELEKLEVVERIDDCDVYLGYRVFNIVFTSGDEIWVCRIS